MDDSVETVQAAATPGEVLARERERLGLSRSEVAQRLHMSPSQVEALEGGDYQRLPKGTFLRGFVRNYARLLGLDAEAAVAMLAPAPRDAAPGIVVPSQNIRFGNERLANSPYVKAGVLATVLLALGFAVMYWWLFVKPTPPALAQKSPDMPPPQQIAAPPAELAAPKNDAPLLPAEPPRIEPAAAAPAVPAAVPGPTPAAATKPAPPPARTAANGAAPRLKFRFRGDSWVEVKDKQGKVLVSKLNTKGSEAEVSGQPPFTVIIGNAPDVTVFVNDREFPLEPHTKVAVARFTVE